MSGTPKRSPKIRDIEKILLLRNFENCACKWHQHFCLYNHQPVYIKQNTLAEMLEQTAEYIVGAMLVDATFSPKPLGTGKGGEISRAKTS